MHADGTRHTDELNRLLPLTFVAVARSAVVLALHTSSCAHKDEFRLTFASEGVA